MSFYRLLPLGCVLSLWLNWANATPYIPHSDNQVLERLPFKPNDPIARDLSGMRRELRQNPKNVDLAVKLARRYYELVAEEGDPRYLGYAQAALAPWWEMPHPPVEVQVLRASLAQFRHDFSGAIKDLTQVLERDPRNGRARALRAVIHIVQARYKEGRADCEALTGMSGELIVAGCVAMADALTGHAASAYRTLTDMLAKHPEAGKDDKLWVNMRLTEMAQRLGRSDQVEKHFKDALGLGITDTFLLANYSDFLLDQKRPEEVVALLKTRTPSDSLLLRLALAEKMLNAPTAKERAKALDNRYAAARMRGDTTHQAEEARFALVIRNDARQALDLARENWKVQREPRDARIFLEAALAAKDEKAAQAVLQWLQDNHIEDEYLRGLARQLTEGGK
ncbi:MAG: hypothetical protein HYS18_16105 [Burkholderiales bacterium]|nr:hypothetical protein [Burkholderiales bacterium]